MADVWLVFPPSAVAPFCHRQQDASNSWLKTFVPSVTSVNPPASRLPLQEQYVFIHDALVEAILCGDTEVAASRLHAYVERLLTPLRDGNTPLDQQLKVTCADALGVIFPDSASQLGH